MRNLITGLATALMVASALALLLGREQLRPWSASYAA